jgi:hypothetical protein
MREVPYWAVAAKLVVLLLGIVAFGVCLLGALGAYAQSGHERFHHYYLHWKQPGTTVSCCNARTTQFGIESGDCEPTRYELRQGDWYAWHRQQDKWIKVPDDRLLRERNPSGEEGHLCSVNHSGQWVILCAVPPDTGG